MGSFVLFSKPVPTIHGVFAPEVTVEFFGNEIVLTTIKVTVNMFKCH